MAVVSVGRGRKARRAFALGWLLIAVGLPGCEGDAPGTSAEIFCSAMCDRAEQCGGSVSFSGCKRNCEADPGNLNDFRPAFVEKFAGCVHGLSCSVFFMDEAFEPCWDQVREDFSPNADTRAFCEDQSRVWFACGVWYFREQCEHDWAVRASESLDRVAQCHDTVPCSKLRSCIDAALGVGQ